MGCLEWHVCGTQRHSAGTARCCGEAGRRSATREESSAIHLHLGVHLYCDVERCRVGRPYLHLALLASPSQLVSLDYSRASCSGGLSLDALGSFGLLLAQQNRPGFDDAHGPADTRFVGTGAPADVEDQPVFHSFAGSSSGLGQVCAFAVFFGVNILIATYTFVCRLVLHARVLAGIIATRVFPINQAAALLCGRLVCSFAWSARAALVSDGSGRRDAGTPDYDAINALLPPAEAEWVSRQHKPYLAALDRIGYLLRDVASDPLYSDRKLADVPHKIALDMLTELGECLCQRSFFSYLSLERPWLISSCVHSDWMLYC